MSFIPYRNRPICVKVYTLLPGFFDGQLEGHDEAPSPVDNDTEHSARSLRSSEDT